MNQIRNSPLLRYSGGGLGWGFDSAAPARSITSSVNPLPNPPPAYRGRGKFGTLRLRGALVVLICCSLTAAAFAEPPASQPTKPSAPTFTRQEDIVYGRSYGAALTFDIFRPT